MSEMIERVAKAIWESDYGVDPAIPWERLAPGTSMHVRVMNQARSVLKAMREPTWPMITNARRVQLEQLEDFENEKGYFAQAYKYMIDAALKE